MVKFLIINQRFCWYAALIYLFATCNSGVQTTPLQSNLQQSTPLPKKQQIPKPPPISDKQDTILRTRHFLFINHNETLSKIEAKRLAEHCELVYTQLTEFVKKKTTLKQLTYHIYPSVEHKGIMTKEMKAASVNFDSNSVAVVINTNFQGQQEAPEQHLLVRNLIGKPNIDALEKGLAIHFTTEWQKNGYLYWTQKLFQSDNLPPLAEVLDNEVFEKESHLVMESMAGSFVAFLISHFGKDKFLKNYDAWQAKDLQVLEVAWKAYLEDKKRDFDFSKSQQSVTIPYLKGFNFAHEGYNIYNGYGGQLAKASLNRLTKLGTNAVAIVPYSSMRDPNKPTPIPIFQNARAENDQAVSFAHFEAQKLGMHTMMKPHIWFRRSWPGEVEMHTEQDWQTFFDNYYRWIRHYALLAEINGFDSFCVGVEFAKATLAKEEAWRKIIKKMRGIYSGPMTYAANWGEEFEQVQFWDELDFIGLNCYYPLSENDKASKRELSRNFRKILNKVERVCKEYNKPLVFTEIGFRSVEAPWKNPHAAAEGRNFNEKHQQLCYEVVFENIQNKEWCNGLLWWKWPTDLAHNGENNVGFSPNLKHTENVIEKYFKTKN